MLWFDTPTADMTPELAAEIVALLNKHPKLIWNNRLGGGYKGDTETPEQYIPAQGYPGRDWESCMTMNDTWGYKSYDTNFKVTETLLRNLIDIASKGGNYLLNIGPDPRRGAAARGRAPARDGQWLAVNGEAIYGTQPTLFGAEAGVIPTDGKGQGRKTEVYPELEMAIDHHRRQDIHSFVRMARHNLSSRQRPTQVTGAYLLADPARRP